MIKGFALGALDTEERGGSGFWPLAFLSSMVLFGSTPPQSPTVSLSPADEADDLSPRSQRGQLCQCSCHQPPLHDAALISEHSAYCTTPLFPIALQLQYGKGANTFYSFFFILPDALLVFLRMSHFWLNIVNSQ